MLYTDSPPAPPEEQRQTCVSYEQNGFLEALTGKALSVWLEFIDETGENVFGLQMQIKSRVTLFSWLVHK